MLFFSATRREISDLETARREFAEGHSGEQWAGEDADYREYLTTNFEAILKHHWNRFEQSIHPGDVIRRFTSFPSGHRCKLYPKAGFICERGTMIVEGVCTRIGADPVSAMEDRAFMLALSPDSGFEKSVLEESDEEVFSHQRAEFMH